MPSWLSMHAVFIAGASAAILLYGGDSAALAADRSGTARVVRAVGAGFRALRRAGVQPQPRPLRAIFTIVPRTFSVPYWQHQTARAIGVETIAPHARATQHDELPAIAAQVEELIGAQAPALMELLSAGHLLRAH